MENGSRAQPLTTAEGAKQILDNGDSKKCSMNAAKTLSLKTIFGLSPSTSLTISEYNGPLFSCRFTRIYSKEALFLGTFQAEQDK